MVTFNDFILSLKPIHWIFELFLLKLFFVFYVSNKWGKIHLIISFFNSLSHGWMVVAFSDFAHSFWEKFGLFELFQKVFAWHEFVFFLWYCQDVFSDDVCFWRFSFWDWLGFSWFVWFWVAWVLFWVAWVLFRVGWFLDWFGVGCVVFSLLPGVDGKVEFLSEVLKGFMFEEVKLIFHWVLLVLVGIFHF